LIESLYRDLLEEGYTFESSEKSKEMSRVQNKLYSNDPNVVATEEEEADIAKGKHQFHFVYILCFLAIALSLSEQKKYTPPVVKEEPKKV
jgi:hypothetical protein